MTRNQSTVEKLNKIKKPSSINMSQVELAIAEMLNPVGTQTNLSKEIEKIIEEYNINFPSKRLRGE